MDRKRRPFAAIPVGLVLVTVIGVASYPFWRPKNDPRVISGLQPLMRFMPRSAFMTKPWINVPWLGGKRLQYPPLSAMPKGFKDRAQMSGIVIWDQVKGATGPPAIVQQFGASFFVAGAWKDAKGRSFEMDSRESLFFGQSASTVKDYCELPYVYGDEPIAFDVTWIDPAGQFGLHPGANPTLQARIELPPNHAQPPKLETVRVKAGNRTVLLIPEEVIGPGFLTRYEVQVEGAKEGEVFLAEFDNSETMNTVYTGHLILTKDKPSVFSASASKGPTKLILRTVKWTETSLVARATKSATPSSVKRFELVDPNGKMVATALDPGMGASFIVQPETNNLWDLTIEGRRTEMFSHGESFVEVMLSSIRALPKVTLREGVKLKATGYRQIRSDVGTFQLPGQINRTTSKE